MPGGGNRSQDGGYPRRVGCVDAAPVSFGGDAVSLCRQGRDAVAIKPPSVAIAIEVCSTACPARRSSTTAS